MSTRAAAWLAWSVWSSCVALTALALLLIVLSGSDPNVEGESFIITATVPLALLGFPTVGALIASRRPENTIGWLFCVAGLFSQLTVFADQYAVYALLTDPGSLPGGLVMATVLNWGLYAPPVAIIVVFLPLLFPSGHLPSRRWRPVLWFAIGFVALAMPSNGLFPDPIELGPLSVENPVGIEGAEEILGAMRGLAGVCLLVGGLGALTSLIVRFRRSRGEERQQLKWFTYAAALVPAALVAADFGFEVLIAPLLPLFPSPWASPYSSITSTR